MEIKEVGNEPITGESLLSMIEESVSEKKKSKQTENDEITEDEIVEDEIVEDDENELQESDNEDNEDDKDDEDGKKSKIGKKEILMFVALGVSVIITGAVLYMMLFQKKEDDAFDAVAPLPTQKNVQKPAQQVETMIQKQPAHQQIKQVDKNSGDPEPLEPINQNLQQHVQQKNVQQQQNLQAIEKKPQTMKENIDEVESVEQKQTIIKPKTIHFIAKSKEDVGINQFAIIDNKAYLSSDLFEKTEFDVEDKEYNAKFNGKTRRFLKVIGEDFIYLPAKQVTDNYSVGK